jgi:DNA-directed RNA polymerase subunit beta
VENGRVTDEITYLAADEEEEYVIAQASATLDRVGHFVGDRVLVRRGPQGAGVRVGATSTSYGATSEVDFVPPDEVDLMDVSPKQIVSVSTALIPFVEHDDANRALMGANMQKQAVPLLVPEAPYIGTGVEARAANDAGELIVAEGDGRVTEVAGDHLVVEYVVGTKDRFGQELGRRVYPLAKFRRSNQNTCINQKIIVAEGEEVVAGSVLADGPSTHNGELDSVP